MNSEQSKFSILRARRQDDFHAEDYNTKPFVFDGIQREVYDNANLSIFVNESCNANCKFCVDQLRFEGKGKQFIKERISDDVEYFLRLEEVLANLRPLDTSISVTGGEPTKSPRLPRILKLVSKYGFRKRVITTNGSGLLDIVDGKRIIDHIVDNGFHHLNISKTHYLEDVNAEVMQFDNSYFTNEQMAEVVKIAQAGCVRPRLSCLLLKSGIYDVNGMMRYMDFYGAMGVDNIIFRETMDYDKSAMNNLTKLRFLEENKVHLNDIWHQIDSMSDTFHPIVQVLGYYYYCEVYKYKGIDMVTESANLAAIDPQKSKAPNTVFEMVFHPNGNLNGSWIEDEDVLLPYFDLNWRRQGTTAGFSRYDPILHKIVYTFPAKNLKQ